MCPCLEHSGLPCPQATNLLRALRQNRGAAALGLLESDSQRSGVNTDIEVPALVPADSPLSAHLAAMRLDACTAHPCTKRACMTSLAEPPEVLSYKEV